MKADANEEGLMALPLEDVEAGRMKSPVPIEECVLTHTLLHPRFAVEQGRRWVAVVFSLCVSICLHLLVHAGTMEQSSSKQ